MNNLENLDNNQQIENSSDKASNIENEYKCKICNKKFPKSKGLYRHMKLHGNKNYKCNQCSNEYSRSDHLKRHLISHGENKTPFECEECYQRFSNKSHLNRHLKAIHTNYENFRFKCDTCDIMFDKKFKLNKHNSKSHNTQDNKVSSSPKVTFECYYPFCQRKFTTYRKQQLHINNTHNKINSEIDLSSALSDFKSEEIPHTHLQCPFENCFKTYSTNFNLKTHIKTFHYSVKEFKCDVLNCNQLFKHKCSLDKHRMRYHQDIDQLRREEKNNLECDDVSLAKFNFLRSCEKMDGIENVEVTTII